MNSYCAKCKNRIRLLKNDYCIYKPILDAKITSQKPYFCEKYNDKQRLKSLQDFMRRNNMANHQKTFKVIIADFE